MESVLQSLDDAVLQRFFPGKHSGTVKVLRLDSLHPVVSGNKVFKLENHLQKALSKQQASLQHAGGVKAVLSFGGPWSNHLHALAYRSHELGLRSIALVRGEPQQTAMLQDAKRWGMDIQFVSYGEYRQRHDQEYLAKLQLRFPEAVIIPEGGGGLEGATACQRILNYVTDETWQAMAIASGTGVTAAGIASVLPAGKSLHIVPALASRKWLAQDLADMLQQMNASAKYSQLFIHHDFHRQGFAQADSDLLRFMQQFESLSGILLEPVYTAKLFMAVIELWQRALQGETISGLSAQETLLLVHTGGLQGRRGFGLDAL